MSELRIHTYHFRTLYQKKKHTQITHTLHCSSRRQLTNKNINLLYIMLRVFHTHGVSRGWAFFSSSCAKFLQSLYHVAHETNILLLSTKTGPRMHRTHLQITLAISATISQNEDRKRITISHVKMGPAEALRAVFLKTLDANLFFSSS
jgi:hypothetical protein